MSSITPPNPSASHFPGQSLDQLLRAPREISAFLRMAIRIVGALAELHRSGLIHKNLKPQNIFIDSETDLVHFTDLSMASRLPREPPPVKKLNTIEGALAYISPEQTGRMNRWVDHRTDLYSLGVIFYQMLTGRLPFEANDALEWVHCHVARSPRAPAEIEKAIPGPASDIVLKLLAKAAEDRYESAIGLRFDLESCLEQWLARGQIEPFPLGARDVPDRLQIPQRLYGREAELASLLGVFDRIARDGAPELVLVSGYSGVGKSALVHELHRPIVRERGVFASGKFDQYKRNIPYSIIHQAFRRMVLEVLTESEENLGLWRERLRDALGANGQIMIDLIPEVELVLGKQPKVPELPLTEAQNRFNMVVQQFLGTFTRAGHPVVIFLDDLQWADAASLNLLKQIILHPDTKYFLLIGAYRDNEVRPSHPLLLTLDEVRKAGATVRDIILSPLSALHLGHLIASALHRRPEEVASLARLVHDRTEGNPFFAIQFLLALQEENLIALDPEAAAFRWDMAKIEAKGFTDNVVDLMVEKLKRLPAATQEALKQLACLGNTSEIAILAMACGRSEDSTHADIWEAIRAGLVIRLDSTYKFLHDRVQEAAYSLIPEDLRAGAHLRIGRILVSHLSREAIEERVFDVVNQFNHGVAMMTDPREKETLCQLNSQAGRKAMASVAHAAARGYLSQAVALLPEEAWSTRYEETFTLHLELSECDYLVGRFQLADERFDLLLASARSNLDRGRVYRSRIRLYQLAGRYTEAVAAALAALRLFAVTFPESGEEIEAAIKAEMQEIPGYLRGRSIADLVDAPLVTDPAVAMVICLLVDPISAAAIAGSPFYPLFALRAVSFSLQHGNMVESCEGYTSYAIVLLSTLGDIPSAYEFSEMSLRLAEKLDDSRMRGKLLCIHGHLINHWQRHIATSLPLLEQSFIVCLEVGDIVFAGFNAYTIVWYSIEKGEALDEVVKTSRRYAAFARESHNTAIYETIRLEQQFIASLKGLTRRPASFDDDAFDEADSLGAITRASFGYGIAFYHVMKQMAAFTFGRYTEALESAQRAGAMFREAMVVAPMVTHHFFYALTLAALCPQGEERQGFVELLEEQRQKLEHWADHCPENFRNRHALVSAEIARIGGRDLEAMHLYEEAIRSAHENGFVHNEGLAYELASRFYRAREFDLVADMHLREARACYARWGASGKVRQLEQLHPQLVEHQPVATAAMALRAEQLDLLSMVKASQSISGEILLTSLQQTLIRIAIEAAGAQNGYLLRSRGGDLFMEVEAHLEGGEQNVNLLGTGVALSAAPLPASIVNYVKRTREIVILDDAAKEAQFAADPYIAEQRPRSVLCLPLVRQTELVGLLYLENNLMPGAFTPDRVTLLSVLASQAAISLENAILYADLSLENAERKRAEEQALGELRARERTESELREQLAVIRQQQEAIRILSVPIMEVWDGVLTVPVLGALDRERAGQIMETLLSAVSAARCRQVIIDVTGVASMDAATAEHVIRIVRAVQLLGAQSIVVGIQPRVARAIVSLGIDLSSITTLANLREALVLCMSRERPQPSPGRSSPARTRG